MVFSIWSRVIAANNNNDKHKKYTNAIKKKRKKKNRSKDRMANTVDVLLVFSETSNKIFSIVCRFSFIVSVCMAVLCGSRLTRLSGCDASVLFDCVVCFSYLFSSASQVAVNWKTASRIAMCLRVGHGIKGMAQPNRSKSDGFCNYKHQNMTVAIFGLQN